MIIFKVKEMMEKRGITTQRELAEAASIHPTRMGLIVHGTLRRIDVDTLNRLCKALDCQPGNLIEYRE